MIHSPVRLVFFGTPAFAVPALLALCSADYQPLLVVTQPDRPKGRGQLPQPSPVRQAARQTNLPTATPTLLNADHQFRTTIEALRPDIAIVVAYGAIIPATLLAIPRLGCLNLHPSLLPTYRGPTPIQTAILNGETKTGVTLMVLDTGVDTGPIISQDVIRLSAGETGVTLTERLSKLGAQLLIKTLPRYLAGAMKPQPQDSSRATVTRRLKKTDGNINWNESAVIIERKIRAYQPWPNSWSYLTGQRVTLFSADAIPEAAPAGQVFDSPPLRVGCGLGSLEIRELQFAGGRRLTATAALGGHQLLGQRFTPQSTA